MLADAPATAALGSAITVSTSGSTPSFALVRMGAVTHSVNGDQRRIPLVPSTVDGVSYTLDIPADAGVVLPGSYLLFALDAQGTPSIARTIRIS